MTLGRPLGLTLAIAFLACRATAEPLGNSLRALKALDLSAARQLSRAEPTRDNFNKLASTVTAVIEAVQTIPLDHVEARLSELHSTLGGRKGALLQGSGGVTANDLHRAVSALQEQISANITGIERHVKNEINMLQQAVRQDLKGLTVRSSRMLHPGDNLETQHKYIALDWDLLIDDLAAWLTAADTGLIYLLDQRVQTIETDFLKRKELYGTVGGVKQLSTDFTALGDGRYLQDADVFDSNKNPEELSPRLIAAADLRYVTDSEANSNYLSISTASNTYLTQNDATSNYLSKTEASTTYLSKANAASTYLSQANAASTYLKIVDVYNTGTNPETFSTRFTNVGDPRYLTQTAASSTYLSQATASTTYLTQSNAGSTYLSQSNAASTYLSQTSAASTYLSQANAATTYLTQANAASTYLSQANAASTYLSQANAASTYLKIVDVYNTGTNPESLSSRFTAAADLRYMSRYAMITQSGTLTSLSTTAFDQYYAKITDVFTDLTKAVALYLRTAPAGESYVLLSYLQANYFSQTQSDSRYLRFGDSSNYVTPAALNTQLANYYSRSQIDSLLSNYLKISDSQSVRVLARYSQSLPATKTGNDYFVTFSFGTTFSSQNLTPSTFVSMSTTDATPSTFTFIVTNLSQSGCTVKITSASSVNTKEISSTAYTVTLLAYA